MENNQKDRIWILIRSACLHASTAALNVSLNL